MAYPTLTNRPRTKEGDYSAPENGRAWLRAGRQNEVTPRHGYGFLGAVAGDAGFGAAEGTPTELLVNDDFATGSQHVIYESFPASERQTLSLSEVSTRTMKSAHWLEKQRAKLRMSMMIKWSDGETLDRPDVFDACQICDDIIAQSYASYGGGFNTRGDDARSIDSVDTIEVGYPSNSWTHFRKMSFANQGLVEVTLPIKDVALTTDRMESVFFALQAIDTGSAAASIHVIDRWGTIRTVSLTDLTNTQDVDALAVMGGRIVVISDAAASHLSLSVDALLEGNYVGSEISTGYTASKNPKAIYVKSAGEAFVVGDGGYIYFLSGPSQQPVIRSAGAVTTQDLGAVAGIDEVVVAGGAAGALVISIDNGISWKALTLPSLYSTKVVSSIACVTERIFFVGFASGELVFTDDQGASFRAVSHGQGLSAISDIKFSREFPSIGYIAGTASSKASILRTHDMGRTWHSGGSFINAQPTGLSAAAIAIADANRIMIGGAAASDGLLALGSD